jgi:hypothetical protein
MINMLTAISAIWLFMLKSDFNGPMNMLSPFTIWHVAMLSLQLVMSLMIMRALDAEEEEDLCV